MGARPAAGPLIVTYEPPRKGRTKPAIMAEVMPVMGGAPEATAMPSENGSEISETTRPARISWRQCLSPARPFWGFSVWWRVGDLGATLETEAADMGSPQKGPADLQQTRLFVGEGSFLANRVVRFLKRGTCKCAGISPRWK